MRKKIITRFDNKAYLIRWSIFSWLKVHKIILPDDTCLHDHPWAFISFIIKGGYVEERLVEWVSIQGITSSDILFKIESDCKMIGIRIIVDKENNRIGILEKRIYGRWSILFRKANSVHRLEVFDKPAWTIVITFKKTRLWGFFTKNGWLPWNLYKQQDSCE